MLVRNAASWSLPARAIALQAGATWAGSSTARVPPEPGTRRLPAPPTATSRTPAPRSPASSAFAVVSRETDPSNRRSVLITLTDLGYETVDNAMSDHVANEARMLAALGPDEREQLANLLRTMLTALGDVPRSG
ncbi:MarR family winged helix-turn-helix transcriptional regulator [Asanoa ferruginea]|uniref:MarR family winged helix-turn-helix transcriptional regulator n=1 Tax=Asanoa ferruginea TaxID=53367 RepID=UPI000E27CA9A|nr:MarR family winged helix-turn-helix transcriptional regulator [Asanoa ferruginea]